jgi:hypothetical protein
MASKVPAEGYPVRFDRLRLQRLASSAAAERPSDDGFSASGNRPRGNDPGPSAA